MRKRKNDYVLGTIVVLFALAASWSAGTGHGLLATLATILSGTVALVLWNKGARFWKVIAIAIIPGILLRYLLPKELRQKVEALKMKKGD